MLAVHGVRVLENVALHPIDENISASIARAPSKGGSQRRAGMLVRRRPYVATYSRRFEPGRYTNMVERKSRPHALRMIVMRSWVTRASGTTYARQR